MKSEGNDVGQKAAIMRTKSPARTPRPCPIRRTVGPCRPTSHIAVPLLHYHLDTYANTVSCAYPEIYTRQ